MPINYPTIEEIINTIVAAFRTRLLLLSRKLHPSEKSVADFIINTRLSVAAASNTGVTKQLMDILAATLREAEAGTVAWRLGVEGWPFIANPFLIPHTVTCGSTTMALVFPVTPKAAKRIWSAVKTPL